MKCSGIELADSLFELDKQFFVDNSSTVILLQALSDMPFAQVCWFVYQVKRNYIKLVTSLFICQGKRNHIKLVASLLLRVILSCTIYLTACLLTSGVTQCTQEVLNALGIQHFGNDVNQKEIAIVYFNSHEKLSKKVIMFDVLINYPFGTDKTNKRLAIFLILNKA